MNFPPDRLSGLIQKLEAGGCTQAEVDRVANLQALDLAKLGEDFVRETCQREDAHTAWMKKELDEQCQVLGQAPSP